MYQTRQQPKMLIHCGLLLLFLNCVRTTSYVNSNGFINDRIAEFNKRFSWWPSVHNAASLVKVRREIKQDGVVLEGEGGSEKPKAESAPLSPTVIPKVDSKDTIKDSTSNATTLSTLPVTGNTQVTTAAPVASTNETKGSSTTEKPKQLDLNNPGVLKRGFIVFGGFALLAIAYFIFYRRKGSNNDVGKTNNTNDANQFRYGVLESEDRRDNLELSRVPLTMESDEDEDEDLEIFDLEQKKKSLSYVNLQTNDEDIVFPHKPVSESDRDNLLLDIEDVNSETLINWSSNGSKSIL